LKESRGERRKQGNIRYSLYYDLKATTTYSNPQQYQEIKSHTEFEVLKLWLWRVLSFGI
jgi:hypothetical protein